MPIELGILLDAVEISPLQVVSSRTHRSSAVARLLGSMISRAHQRTRQVHAHASTSPSASGRGGARALSRRGVSRQALYRTALEVKAAGYPAMSRGRMVGPGGRHTSQVVRLPVRCCSRGR